jgi:Suppressor of fused protein (SUFU)
MAPARASVTFVGVEPIEVLRFEAGPERWYVSLGMSRRPMTGADAAVLATGPRAELAITTLADPARNERSDDGLWRRLAVLAAAPAVEGVVYREGMAVELGEPLVPASRCVGVLVGPTAWVPVVQAGIEVPILLLQPATATELAWARVHGGPALQARWAERDVELRDLWRPAVGLD